QRLRDDAQRVRMDVETMLLRHMEEAQEVGGIVAEAMLALDVEPAGIDDETFDRALARPPGAPGEARPALRLELELGAEDAREVADFLGDQEVVLHEALDAARAGMVGVAHAPPDLALAVEGEAVLGALGEVVQVAAHRPQEGLRALEAV